LYKHFPRNVLPKEYGGDGAPTSEFISKWEQTLLSGRDEILSYRQYGIDETKRQGKSLLSKWSDGVDGTFRKLSVD
jgi:hypothetical protein